MQNLLPIAGRQFRSYFNGPVAYVVAAIVTFLVALPFWMFFFLQGRATVSGMFEWIGYALVFVIPPLTMGLVAGERENGTLEVLMTMPVTDAEVIVGKFLGTYAVLAIVILLTFVNPIAVAQLGDLDWGPVWSGYVGALLLGAAMLAMGLMISAWFHEQILALFFAYFLLIPMFWIVPAIVRFFASGMHGGGWFWDSVANVLEFISPQEHLQAMTIGVLDTRDILYFLSLITFGLLASFSGLASRRWS